MLARFLRWSVVAIVVALVLGAGVQRYGSSEPTEGAAESEAPDRPHVILISVDTLRADHLGCYGYAPRTSPRLDEFARQSVRFANAFSQASWTLPSHMSVMTSQYPHVHGVEEGEHALAEGTPTLAKALSGEGYYNAAFVSWVYLGRKYGFASGFNEFNELLPPPELVDSATSSAFKAEQVTDRAIEWLNRDHSRPFFLFVHYFDPHINYEPPSPLDKMFDPGYHGPAKGTFGWLRKYIKGLHHRPKRIGARELQHVTALYDGEIRYTDTHLGRLFDAIEATVGLDNCLIAFTSDHGEEFDEHGSMEGHQWTLYDEVVHVPLIVRLPGGAQAGRVVTSPVELIDIPATILGRLGLAAPSTFQGRDRNELMEGGTPAPEDTLVFGENRRFNRKQYVRDARYKLIHTNDIGLNKRGVPVTPGYELFDLVDDPGEQRNIFDASTPVAQRLMRQLEERKRSTVSTARPDDAPVVTLSAEELKRLRSLGYVAGP